MPPQAQRALFRTAASVGIGSSRLHPGEAGHVVGASATIICGMRLRPATAADVPAVLAIQRETPTLSQWSQRQYEDIFAAGSSRVAAVMEEDVVVLGFVIAREIGSEWEIENIAVTAAARRQGVATRLLQHAIEVARERGGRVLFLEVRESNHPALRLYDKQGFTLAGRRGGYYVDPVEDALVYRLLLQPTTLTAMK
jgi:ribosomal-protein-alanine acetyltransferase